jgi:hypothetical protein
MNFMQGKVRGTSLAHNQMQPSATLGPATTFQNEGGGESEGGSREVKEKCRLNTPAALA